jgi:signal transduction histidine kinase
MQHIMNPENLRKLKHELRTPVNHILGYSDLLLETADDSGDFVIASLARDIHARGETLAKLLEKGLLSPSSDMDNAQMDGLRDAVRVVITQILETLSSHSTQPGLEGHSDDLGRIRRAADQLMALVAGKMAISNEPLKYWPIHRQCG